MTALRWFSIVKLSLNGPGANSCEAFVIVNSEVSRDSESRRLQVFAHQNWLSVQLLLL